MTGPDQMGDLRYAGFLHPDGSTISIILLNLSDEAKTVNITISKKRNFSTVVPEHSIQTYLCSLKVNNTYA